MFVKYGRETISFIDFIIDNLEALNSKVDLTALVNQQIGFVQGKLKLLRDITYLVSVKRSGEFISHTRTWANHISCLVCLYWIDGTDERLVSTMGSVLSDLMHRTLTHTTSVVASYYEGKIIPQLFTNYFDFLLEDFAVPMKDDVEILREGLILLSLFVMDPPEEVSKDKLTKIYFMIDELPSFIHSIHFDGMKEGISEAKFSGLLQKINRVKDEVRDMCLMTPNSSFNSIKTNAVGFLDSLLGNLKKMWKAKVNFNLFIKHQVEVLTEELASLRPFFQNITELQNEHEEIKNLWTRTINVVYNAYHVIKLCPLVPLWYSITCLSNVIEDVKLIMFEVKRIDADKMYSNKKLTPAMKPSNAPPPQAMISKFDGAFIGFKEDARLIIDYLIRGQEYLTIISISGLPGQGKITLAKRIYNNLNVQHHCHKIVWCYVSKDCAAKELLLKIIHEVGGVEVKQLEIQDLVEHLRKSLKGKRYFIVMDDIWDVDAWRKMEGSFPDDKNGSRILFTSRNHDLASQAKLNSISHPLPLFSDEESWELMKEKLFHCDGCTPEFLGIGKQIASYCKGLPLAVVLTATILRSTEQKLDLWNEVAKDLKSHLAREGCGKIIGLSFKNLPNHLKPCFLYFGTFPRGENISAKKLKLLWIAEGFINDNEAQSSEDLANGYLNNLVSQSLVVVTERSSTGEMKRCNVHDLLYDFCLEKAMEDNFLHWADEKSVVSDLCKFGLQKYNHHRLWTLHR